MEINQTSVTLFFFFRFFFPFFISSRYRETEIRRVGIGIVRSIQTGLSVYAVKDRENKKKSIK